MNNTVFPLSELPEGGQARVRKLHIRGAMRRRLQDLGLVEGTKITCVQKAVSGDPTAYIIRGAVIALRKNDAAKIEMGA